jgi:hypothetical protein
MMAPMNESRIERVTVYREGARVERVMLLEAHVSEVRFTRLPLTLDDGSLRVRVEAGDTEALGPVAVDVRVALEVPEEDPTLAPAEDAALEAARFETQRCLSEVSRLKAALERLEAIKIVARPPPRENEPPLPIPVESRGTLLAIRAAEEQRLGAELTTKAAAAREAEKRLADATHAAARATTSRNAKQHELRKVVVVKLAGGRAAAGTSRVVLDYAIPHACWSASYVLTLPEPGAGRKPARLGMRALVAQRSGEDWRGVKLALSTADADAWVELPELARSRIGRAQPPPRKAGFREPPEGALALYADYDRVAGPPVARRDAPPAQDEAAEEREAPLERGAMGPLLFGGAAPTPLAAPPPAAAPGGRLAAPMSVSARAGGAPATPGAGAMALGRQAPPAPQAPARSRSVRREAATEDLAAALEKSVPLEEPLAAAPDWSLAAEALAYGRLRMCSPSDASRSELTLVAQASVYAEALAHVRVDVAAVIRIAFDRARVDTGSLPRGFELARSHDAYDYLYETALPCDVPSAGSFHAVPVADWDAETELRHVSVPREAPHVYRVLDVSSPIDAALLSGPLDVYEASAAQRDGDREVTYRTTTRMPPTPPRGRVEIGLGVEPAIKIARTTTFQEESAGLLGGSLALAHRVSVEVRNLLPRPVTVEVRERVPVVREDDPDVKVDIGAVEPSWESWDQEQSLRGGHRWKVPLEPGATRTLSASYTIKLPAKLELVGGNRRES